MNGILESKGIDDYVICVPKVSGILKNFTTERSEKKKINVFFISQF